MLAAFQCLANTSNTETDIQVRQFAFLGGSLYVDSRGRKQVSMTVPWPCHPGLHVANTGQADPPPFHFRFLGESGYRILEICCSITANGVMLLTRWVAVLLGLP